MTTKDPYESGKDSRKTSCDRRSVLKGLGLSAVVGTALTGTASAHEVIGKPAFYGTKTLSVCVSGKADVLMARETHGDFEVGFIVGPDKLDPYPEGDSRYEGNFSVSTDNPEIPDGQIIGLQVGGTRWVNPNKAAQPALGAEREQLASTHDRPVGVSAARTDGLPCRGAPTTAPDVPLLNYALMLEHIEHACYRDGLATFSDEELLNAAAISKVNEELRTQLPEYLTTMRDHEKAHVDTLTTAVENRGGDPVGEGTYDFGYSTPTEFFNVAAGLENTGVAAYAGVTPHVVSNDILAAIAGIQSVEARHASVVNLVTGASPFPDSVDEAMASEDGLDVAGEVTTSAIDPSVFEVREQRPPRARKRHAETGDVAVLNDVLALNHLANACYRDGLAEFSDTELRTVTAGDGFDTTGREDAPDYLRRIQAHKAAHVSAITDTIETLGGVPVTEATYSFGYTTPTEFCDIAKTVANASATAVVGAALAIENDSAFTTAIGIHTVDARHAAVLNALSGDTPFPDIVDEPTSIADIEAVTDQFIVETCSNNLNSQRPAIRRHTGQCQ